MRFLSWPLKYRPNLVSSCLLSSIALHVSLLGLYGYWLKSQPGLLAETAPPDGFKIPIEWIAIAPSDFPPQTKPDPLPTTAGSSGERNAVAKLGAEPSTSESQDGAPSTSQALISESAEPVTSENTQDTTKPSTLDPHSATAEVRHRDSVDPLETDRSLALAQRSPAEPSAPAATSTPTTAASSAPYSPSRSATAPNRRGQSTSVQSTSVQSSSSPAPAVQPTPPPASPPPEPPAPENFACISCPAPAAYPRKAHLEAITGSVQVFLEVSPTGSVLSAHLGTSSGSSELDAVALQVTQSWQFTPTRNGRHQVPVYVDFELTN